MREEAHEREDGQLAHRKRHGGHQRDGRVERREDAGQEDDGRLARQPDQAEGGRQKSRRLAEQTGVLKQSHGQRDGQDDLEQP